MLCLNRNNKALAKTVDDLAELIIMHGGQAKASFKDYSALTSIQDGQADFKADKMLADLAGDHKKMIKSLKQVMIEAEKMESQAILNFTSAQIDYHHKVHWALYSHLL